MANFKEHSLWIVRSKHRPWKGHPTLVHWHFQSGFASVQMPEHQWTVGAKSCPRTSPQLREVSSGRESRPRQGAPLPPPGQAPGGPGAGWAGWRTASGGSGWAWAPCCCGSSTGGRSRRAPRGRPGVRQDRRPAGTAGCTAASPAGGSRWPCSPGPATWGPRCSCSHAGPDRLCPAVPGSCAPAGWTCVSRRASSRPRRWPTPSRRRCPAPRTGGTGSAALTGFCLGRKNNLKKDLVVVWVFYGSKKSFAGQ